MKKLYEEPKTEIIIFNNEDVVLTSGESETKPGFELPGDEL